MSVIFFIGLVRLLNYILHTYIQDYSDTSQLLNQSNIDMDCLYDYCIEAADWSTELPRLDFAVSVCVCAWSRMCMCVYVTVHVWCVCVSLRTHLPLCSIGSQVHMILCSSFNYHKGSTAVYI